MALERFGTLEGADIHEATIRSGGGAEAKILNWGALIRDLQVPTPRGPQRVVLGLNRIEDYVAHSPYFGAIVGRYANRIGQARFTLAGEEHRLDVNEQGKHQLHGGSNGFGTKIWSFAEMSERHVTLILVSPDGDMGYPGRLIATCTYAFVDAARLRITLEATTDRATPVNLTSHSYYNLDGSSDICSHHLMIAADFVTPTDAELIPTGEIRSVADEPLDFRELRPIGASQLLQSRTKYDINYVLHGGPGLAHAATLASRRNGLKMELWTTEPGLQFYDGHLLDMPVPGLDGVPYRARGGLCLEPQRFPDGPNRLHFPACILEPGAVSRQVSELRFSNS